MRTLNSFKNIITGVGGQLLTFLLQFISRTVFIRTLGSEYLGISGLFTNVITILSISELGIGTAIVYSLYKPLADGNKEKIQATMNFFKKAYFFVGCAVAVLGLILTPFLPYIMKGTTDLVNVNLIFFLYLLQSVSSYWFFAYKSLLLQADQKNYISNFIQYIVLTITICTQIVLLFLFKSFLLYLITGIASNIIFNFLVAKKVDKLYPYIKEKNDKVLPREEKKAIYKNTIALSMYKVGSTVLTATDNIVISSFISVISVGLYSNYLIITNAVRTVVRLIFSSFTASIGNLYATETKEKSEFIFRCINFLNFWIYGFCAICLWILLNPFIYLWVGTDYLFDNYVVFFIVLNFLTAGLQDAVIEYRSACGLFWHGKFRPLFSALLNVVISILLVGPLGIAGVLLGTIISRFLTTWWYDPWIVHKYAFGISPVKYFLRYFRSLIIILITGALVQLASIPFSENTWLNFFIKLLICIVVPNFLFFALYRKSKEFKYITRALKPLLSSMKKKLFQLQD